MNRILRTSFTAIYQLTAKASAAFFAFLLVLLFSSSVFGQVLNDFRSLTATGNWNTLATWERFNGTIWVAATVLPGATANNGNVTIRDGHTITITATPTAAISSLTVGEGVSGILQYHNSATPVSLTVTGNLTVATGGTFRAFVTPTVSGTHTLIVNGATITNNGTIDFRITSGSFNSIVNTTLSAASGTQTLAGTPTTNRLNNLIIAGATTSVTTNTALSVNDLTINASRVLADGGNVITVRGNIVNSGTHSGAGSITIAGGTVAHTITSAVNCTYSNLVFNDASFATTITNTGSLNPTNTTFASVTIQRGVLNIGAMVTTGTGGLFVTGLTTVGDGTNAATLAHTVAGGTRNYTGGITINNLGVFNNTTGPAGNNIGDITVNTGGIWNNSNNSTWAVTGNVTNVGTFTSGSGTYTLSGSTRTINGTIQFTGISMSGTYTNNGTTTVTTTFNGGGTLTQAANSILNLSVSPFPTLNCTANTPNLIRYFGASGYTIKAATYHNLTIDMNSALVTATAPTGVVVNNNFIVNAGTFSDGGFQITGNATGIFNVNDGATYTTTRSVTPWFPTAYTNNILDSTSTFNYNGTLLHAIPTTPVTTYGHLGFAGGAVVKTLAANTVCNNLSVGLTGATLANGGFNITVKGNLTLTGTALINGTGRVILNGGIATHTISAGTGSVSNIELNDVLGANQTTAFSILGTLTQTSGTWTIAASQTLTLGAASSLSNTLGNFGGTTTSNLTIAGSGALGDTLRFASGVQNLGTLTFSRTTSGTTILGSDLTINTGLQLSGAASVSTLLNIGSFNITMGATATFTAPTVAFSATNMIIADGSGELRKTFAIGTTALFTFPIGDVSGVAGAAPNNNNTGADYSPVAITMSANPTTIRTIGVRVTDRQNINDVTTTNNISRYWSFSDNQAGVGTYTYTGTFTYSITAPSDLTGTQNLASINRWNGSTWTPLLSTFPANGYTITGATETTGTLGGNSFTARVSDVQTYTWIATSGSGNWTTPANWSPARVSPFTSDILQFTNGGTPTATNIPTQTIGRLIIDSTDATFTSAAATQTLTISNTSGTNFTVANDAILRLSSTLANSTIIAFAGTNVTDIAGTIELNTNTGTNNTINFTNLLAANNIITGTITNNGGVVTATTVTTTFGAGSFYNHTRAADAIPAANWNATSTCTVSGATTPNPFTGIFGNLTINTSGTATLSAASTVNGNLTVTAGTFSDGSFQITGNASGTLSVADGATLQIGTGGTGTAFPTLFTNITLSSGTPGSTVVYGSNASQNIAGLIYHNLTLGTAGVKTLQASATVNRNLAINNCTFSDNGFQITGNATGTFTMSASANSILILGNATVATAFPTNFIAGNITLSSPSVVRYNSNLNQTVSNVPTYSVLQIQSAAGTPTKTLAGNTLVTGSATPMVNIGAGNTFNLGGFNLTLTNSGGTSPITNTGTISANTDGGSTIILNGTGHNFTPGTIVTTARPNLTVIVNSGQTVGVTQVAPLLSLFNLSIATNNILSLSAGAQLGIGGTYTNNGTLTANTSGTTITLNGTSPQTFTVGLYTGSSIGSGTLATSGGLTINNPAGVTLGSALNVPVLTLTNGRLTTTSAFIINVTGTAVTCVSGGSATSYVNGPLVRSLPASLVSGSTYTFPVGKANFNTFDLINPTTTLASTVRVEVIDATAGGTDGIGFSTPVISNRYWQASVPTGALTSGGTVRLLDASVTVNGNTIVGNSSTLTGTYNPLGGTNPNAPSSGYITSTFTTPTALGFYKFGDRGCLSGTYTVGPTGNFPKLTNAIATLNGSLVCADVIFELQAAYVGTSGETFPITINAANYSGGPWNIVVRPEAAVASNLTTSGSSTSQIFNFNGIDKLTFDGRPGGTGSTTRWVIANTSTSGQVIAFNNDATLDTLEYLQIEGVNTTAPGTGAYTNAGLIAFGNTAPALGNENNVIDNCFIKDGATTPINAIYSYGLSTVGLGNDNNSITNNRLANVWAAATSTSFINLQNGTSTWTINGNSFYQTATRTGTTGTSTHTMILISNTSGNGFTINNNFIGGTAASAGGTAWTQTGIADGRFNGMTLSVGSATASNVQGNTIGNMSWAGNGTATVNSAMFHAIYVTNGLINIGTTTGNVIGNATYPITITFNNTTLSQAGTAYGIYNNSPNGQINIQNNTISSITGAITASTSFNFSAIVFGQGTGSAPSRIINDNTISNITIAGSGSSAGSSNLYGIAYTSGSSAAGEIKNNNIFSLTNNYTGSATGSQVVGIQIPTTPNAFTITGNTLYSLSCAATHTSTTTSSAAIGISYTSSISSGHNISNNIIHSLSAGATAVASNVIGIYYSPALSGSGNSIDGNFIHSLSLSTSSTSGTINGIMINQGSTTVSNNMIRLGLRADATNITTGYTINGINETATLNNFYFNSVYIGGTGVASSTIPTYALLSAGSGTRAIQNNIFWNARSNAAGTAKHYAIRHATITGLTISHNDLLANGTGGVLGNIGGTDNTSLTAFGTNNISSNPQFINPTGDNGIITPGTNDVDLHIQPSPTATPIEGTGINISGITVDFDNETRASLSPEDMGADAGDFTPIDLTPPTVSYTPFASVCNTVSVYTVTATITDAGLGSSVNVTAGTKPRLYFKKSTDANTLAGWKFVEATNATSPFSFDIDFSLIGGVSSGSVQYFIVAQDQGVNVLNPNVAINSGTFAATPTSVALTSAAFPIGATINSFAVLPCSGTITVGTGGNYLTLTNAGGVFEAINAATLTGNLTVNIISDITIEDGTHGLNQFASPHIVTIQSNDTARTVSGAYTGAALGLFRLNGADRVTFNGGTTTQRLLTFRNTNTSSQNATFVLANDASNNQLNNLIVEGGATSTNASGVVLIGSGATLGTGNDNNTIIRCDIRDLTTTTSLTRNGIYAAGLSATVVNDNNTIQDCNIYNFFVNGAQSSAIRLEANNSGWTISGNRIFQTATRTASLTSTDQYLLYINSGTSGGGFNINGNTIGYAAADATGTYTFSSTGQASRMWGIFVNAGSTLTTITNNTISGISFSTTSGGNITSNGGAFTGINIAAGRVDIGSVSGNGNTIGAAIGNGAISVTLFSTSPATSAAIAVYPSTSIVNTYRNTIGSIDANANASNLVHNFNAIYYNSGSSAVNVSNNTIANIRCMQAAVDQNLFGIRMILPAGVTGNVNDNSISELYSNGGSSGAGQVIGINTTSAGIYSLNRNTIFSLTNEAINSNTTTTQSVVGISYSGSASGQLISNNRIYRLIHTTTTGTVSMSGIYFSGSTNAAHLIERNFIHSFNFLSSSNTANNFGVFIDGTSGGSLVNNMVRLGIRADSSSVPNSTVIQGIYDNSSTANNFHFNTVYIGGSSVSVQTSNTFAFRRNVNSGADNIRNNIFANVRTGGGSSIHYAFATNGTGGYTAAGFDNNIFHSAGNTELSTNNGTSALTAATPALRMQALRAASTGNNLRSAIATLAQINFINATGDAANVNLRLNNANSAAGAGIVISGITTDFDGTVTRANPPAIGAHESVAFNAIATGYDIYTPVVTVSTVPPLVASCGSSQTITITATVTDVGLGLDTGSLQPTLWWRLSSGSYASLAPSSSSGNTFTYTLNLTGITTGQTYHYYVAAQDIESPTNVFYSNFNATTPVHADVAAAASPLQANPATFTVNSVNPLSGTVTVGTSGTYPRFNGTGGLFEAINNNGLSGNLQVNVISDVAELANWTPLFQWTEYCGTGYTVTISPNSTTIRTIEANTSAANAMFSFLGVQRVIIDGRFAGAGRYLRLRHNRVTSIFQPTVNFNNGAKNCVLRSCLIEGSNTNLSTATNGSAGVVQIGGTMGFASGTMRDITIQDNLISNASNITPTLSNVPMYLVYMGGASSGGVIRNINVLNNDMTNFQGSAVIADNGNTTPNSIGDSITISGNNIYQTLGIPTYQYPISLMSNGLSKGHIISNNKIGGNAVPNPNITGTWTNTKADGEVVAIYVLNGGTNVNDGVTIEGNTISNISITGQDYTNFIGIRNESGYAKIRKNTISTIANSGGGNSLSVTDNTATIGIWNQSDFEVIIDSNIINGMSTPNINKRFLYMNGIQHGSNQYHNGFDYTNNPAGKVTISNNTILNLSCGSGLQSVSISPDALIGIFSFSANGTSGNLIENNLVYNISGTLLSSFNTRIWGIGIGLGGYGSTQQGIVRNNRIFDINNANPGSGTQVTGLLIGAGSWDAYNNMISINNSDYPTANPLIVGLYDWTTQGRTTNIYNNSVYIGGTATTSTNSSYAYLRTPDGLGNVLGANVNLRNNIFFNDRTGASSNNIAIGNLTQGISSDAAVGWNSNYNFLLTRNTNQIGRWVGTSSGDRTFANWRTTSSGDNNSWSVAAATTSSNSQLLATDFFDDITLGRLFIKPNHVSSWFVNGKGVAGTQSGNLTVDFEQQTRGTTYGFGIDIGADEFTPTVAPHAIIGSPTPALSGTTNFDFAGRRIGNVVFGSSGTVPTSITAQYYSGDIPGTSPSPSYSSSSYADFYTYFNPSGGSAFTYDAILNYDDALTGTYVSNPSLMTLLQTDAGNNWADGAGTTNTTTKTITGTSDLSAPSYVSAGDVPCTAIVISPQPINDTTCENTNASFTVTATGTGLSYQWQVDTDGAGPNPFSAISNGGVYSNATTNTLNITGATAAMNGYLYRVRIASTCTTAVNSSSAVLTINVAPSITAQPSNVSIPSGSNTTFSVSATGSGTITYVWQLSTNGGSTWSNVPNSAPYSNVTSSTMNITAATIGMNSYQYRVIVSGLCSPPDTSTAAVLTVTSACTLNTWTGATNSLWEEAGNWSCSVVPDTSINVVIPNVTNDPVININITGGVKNIIIEASGNLTMVDNAILNVTGDFENNGSFSFSGTSNVVLLGNRAQSLKTSWVSGNNNSFNLLTLNKSVTNTVTALDNINVLTKTMIEKGELVIPQDVVARSKRVELKDKLLIRDIGTGTKAGELRVNE